MTKTTQTAQILKWFGKPTSKAYLAAVWCCEQLALAEAQGFWPKGVSRKLHAALNKQTVAIKFARESEATKIGTAGTRDRVSMEQSLLQSINNGPEGRWYEATLKGWNIEHAMMFGQFTHAPEIAELVEKLRPYATTTTQMVALQSAANWACDFTPVAELVALLDSRRAQPVFVMKTLSPTVAANVGKAMGLALDTITIPEIKYTLEDRLLPDGRTIQVWVGEIIWPEGTRHNASRFAHGTVNNAQCHACGHAIKNAFNWVPLYATVNVMKSKASLWVGRDCAKKLFGCDVTGDAEYVERKAAA